MEYYERCRAGYKENGLPIFKKDPTLTVEQLKEAKRIYNAEYHRIYNRNKGSENGETYAQKYYKLNKEKVREMNKSYRERHPEKMKEYKKRTYERHREKYLNRAKRNYEANKEEIRERMRSKYAPNGNPRGRPKKEKVDGVDGVDILKMLDGYKVAQVAQVAQVALKVELWRGYSGRRIHRRHQRKALRLRK